MNYWVLDEDTVLVMCDNKTLLSLMVSLSGQVLRVVCVRDDTVWIVISTTYVALGLAIHARERVLPPVGTICLGR